MDPSNEVPAGPPQCSNPAKHNFIDASLRAVLQTLGFGDFHVLRDNLVVTDGFLGPWTTFRDEYLLNPKFDGEGLYESGEKMDQLFKHIKREVNEHSLKTQRLPEDAGGYSHTVRLFSSLIDSLTAPGGFYDHRTKGDGPWLRQTCRELYALVEHLKEEYAHGHGILRDVIESRNPCSWSKRQEPKMSEDLDEEEKDKTSTVDQRSHPEDNVAAPLTSSSPNAEASRTQFSLEGLPDMLATLSITHSPPKTPKHKANRELFLQLSTARPEPDTIVYDMDAPFSPLPSEDPFVEQGSFAPQPTPTVDKAMNQATPVKHTNPQSNLDPTFTPTKKQKGAHTMETSTPDYTDDAQDLLRMFRPDDGKRVGGPHAGLSADIPVLGDEGQDPVAGSEDRVSDAEADAMEGVEGHGPESGGAAVGSGRQGDVNPRKRGRSLS